MKYGDYENVNKDVKTLTDILYRQGYSLLIDVIAERIGNSKLDYKLSDKEIMKVTESVITELKEAIQERT